MSEQIDVTIDGVIYTVTENELMDVFKAVVFLRKFKKVVDATPFLKTPNFDWPVTNPMIIDPINPGRYVATSETDAKPIYSADN